MTIKLLALADAKSLGEHREVARFHVCVFFFRLFDPNVADEDEILS